MQVVHERCTGLDVHKKTVVTYVLITLPDGTFQREIHTFSATTADLLLLNDWLETLRVRVVALKSTDVFWKPVFNQLEDRRTIVLVNPQRIKAMPGRKTDVQDAEWLADLLRYGLLTPSFIPPVPIGELGELTRYRKHLVEARPLPINVIISLSA